MVLHSFFVIVSPDQIFHCLNFVINSLLIVCFRRQDCHKESCRYFFNISRSKKKHKNKRCCLRKMRLQKPKRNGLLLAEYLLIPSKCFGILLSKSSHSPT